MYARITLVFLLASAAQQGLATSVSSSNNIGYSYDVYDVIEIATDFIPRLGFATGLTRGFEQCKIVLQSVGSGISAFFKNIIALKDDAFLAYKQYKECEKVKDANRAKVCKEAVRLEYFDSVREGVRLVYESVKQVVGSSFKLPLCMVTKP